MRKSLHSTLELSGRTNTATHVHQFAGTYVSAIKKHFNKSNLVAKLHPFRQGAVEGLKLTIHTDVSTNNPFEITIIAGINVLLPDEQIVYKIDMAEAFHFVGIITTALNAPIKAGSLKLETNKEVTVSDTSTIMNLWR